MNDTDKSSALSIVAEFADAMASQTKPTNPLKIEVSDFSVFNTEKLGFHVAEGFGWTKDISDNARFDLILADSQHPWI